MTPNEVLLLCRYISGACPQQRFDEYTPDIWFDILAELPFGVASAAARQVAAAQPFVAPSEILRAARRMRIVTRRAVKRAAREAGVLVDLSAEVDAVITSGAARFDGINLLADESQDSRFYHPEVADLKSWTPGRREIRA